MEKMEKLFWILIILFVIIMAGIIVYGFFYELPMTYGSKEIGQRCLTPSC